MLRYITIDERKPQPGDVIRRGRERYEVRHWHDDPHKGGILVWDGRGLTRGTGPAPYGGWHCWHIPAGSSGWRWYPPYRYESRADGGNITHPLDAGAWV